MRTPVVPGHGHDRRRYRDKGIAIAGTFAVHLAIILLLLSLAAVGPLDPVREQAMLKLWDLPDVKAPMVQVPEPQIEPMPDRSAPSSEAGGQKAGNPPARVPAAPLLLTPPEVPIARLVPAAPSVAPVAPLPSVSADGAGTADGAGDGAAGTGSGGGTGDGQGGGAGSGRPPVARLARWVRLPRQDELNPHIPKETLKQKISGQALLLCQVQSNRRLRACSILRETPMGSGFGQAALAASPKFRIYPTKIDGKVDESGWVVVPIHYYYRR